MKMTRLEKKQQKQELKDAKRLEKQELKLEKKKNKIEKRVGKKSGKILKWILIILGLSTSISVGAISMVLMDKFSKMETVEIKREDLMINMEIEDSDFGEGYFNVAIFGGDSRKGVVDTGVLTDTIMIASLNNETKEVRLVSVYRDTLLNMSDGSYNKANAAYSFGGPTKAINMLNTNLDLNIEKYITVDFSIVVDVIDALGGIVLEIDEFEIAGINKYIPETARVSGVDANLITKAGEQLLDGAQATTYARVRSTTGGDFKRTDRQRYVIEKIVEKLKKSDLSTLNKIIDTALPRISTNFTATEIAYYAAAYLNLNLGANTGFPELVSGKSISGIGSCVIPENLETNVKLLHEFLFNDEDYEPSSTVKNNSAQIISHAGGGGGVANTNTQYTTHNENNTSNLGIDANDLTILDDIKKFDNPEITFE